MTRYQRGDLMEGWNDCPPPTLSRDSSSSSISTARSKRRTPRLSGLVSGTEPPTPRRVSGATAPPNGPPTVPPGAPPMGRTALAASSILGSNLERLLNTTGTESAAESFGDINQTPEKLQSILKGADLSANDETFFTKRILDVYPTLSENHKGFVSKIVHGLASGQESATLKGEILNYMMIHSGVSTWCVPLKKLVESI